MTNDLGARTISLLASEMITIGVCACVGVGVVFSLWYLGCAGPVKTYCSQHAHGREMDISQRVCGAQVTAIHAPLYMTEQQGERKRVRSARDFHPRTLVNTAIHAPL